MAFKDSFRKRKKRVQTIQLPKYEQTKYSFSSLKSDLNLKQKLILAFVFAGLTGLGAQIRIPLPFTPVPVTLQVFFVLLSGFLLGARFGGFSQALYVGLGTAGIPWFSGFKGGFGILTGITGGYLIGFIIAALLVGFFTEKWVRLRFIPAQLFLMVLGVLAIYGFGALWFWIVFQTDFLTTLLLTVIPFIPVDIAKAVSVALIGHTLTTKTMFNGKNMQMFFSERKDRILGLGFILSLTIFLFAYLVLSQINMINPLNFETAKMAFLYSIGVVGLSLLFKEIFRIGRLRFLRRKFR